MERKIGKGFSGDVSKPDRFFVAILEPADVDIGNRVNTGAVRFYIKDIAAIHGIEPSHRQHHAYLAGLIVAVVALATVALRYLERFRWGEVKLLDS